MPAIPCYAIGFLMQWERGY